MLKIAAVTLYKHGLGYFERAGTAQGRTVELSVPRRAMDDVLKSLTLVPSGNARVNGVAFETPDDRNADARRRPIAIDDAAALSGLVRAFAGASVKVSAGGREVAGRLLGLEREEESHLKRAVLVIATADGVVPVALASVTALSLDDERARDDLAFSLEQRQRDEERALLRIDLSAPADVALSYIAPAPAWRVSYRILIAPAKTGETDREVFVQGWALFDNTLDEDLDSVRLTLTAGMPVSFRYGLHQPNTPERPLVEDEERTLDAPFEFIAGAAPGMAAAGDIDAVTMAMPVHAKRMTARALTAEHLEQSAPSQASSQERSALFAYIIDAPVSVRRGQSGMVPIVSFRERGKRELIYTASKHATHPAATVRLKAAAAATLERGPAIVIDGGAYGGEAVVPFTVGGADMILGYAVELGVVVRHASNHCEDTAKLSFRDRSVFIDTVGVKTTTYEVTSSLGEAVEVLIEHTQSPGATFELAADEQVLGMGRFRVAVPARGTVQLAIVERTPRRRQQDVAGLTGQAIQAYLKNRLLTAETVQALGVILAKEAEIAAREADRRTLEAERKAARMRVDDAVKSLGALDARRDGALRERFVAQLDSHDKALLALDQRERELMAETAVLKAAVDAAVRSLSAMQPA
jgi:hypothetical protein